MLCFISSKKKKQYFVIVLFIEFIDKSSKTHKKKGVQQLHFDSHAFHFPTDIKSIHF